MILASSLSVSDATAFRHFVDDTVLGTIRAGARRFPELLQRLPSIFPTEVLSSINRLSKARLISDTIADLLKLDAASVYEPQSGEYAFLSLPHPLDFEWRFTSRTSRSLLKLADTLTPAHGDISLFGTPGLAAEVFRQPMTQSVRFFAEDNLVTRCLIAHQRRTSVPMSIILFKGRLPRASADTLLLDPPWYMDFFRPMLATAAFACRQGGVICMSLLPRGTRPGAIRDRKNILRFATQLGLRVIDYRPLEICYETPFFEANALAATGVNVPQWWRRGDLVVFRKSTCQSHYIRPFSGKVRQWSEASVGEMRVYVRSNVGDLSGDEGLLPLVHGDVLPSVSRRDIRRQDIHVWTSGNRVFRTDNPALVIAAAESLGGSWARVGAFRPVCGSIHEHESIERVCQKLMALASLEADERRSCRTLA